MPTQMTVEELVVVLWMCLSQMTGEQIEDAVVGLEDLPVGEREHMRPLFRAMREEAARR